MSGASSLVAALAARFDLTPAGIAGCRRTERRLSELRGCFADTAAFEAELKCGDPLVYAVASLEPAAGEGDLHCGIGELQPGRVGREFWMTKGHLHAWRPAAEVYVGLSGSGLMLLEDEATGESRAFPLAGGTLVYVPGGTAHRTINTGAIPLVYLGVYPARAGHDYEAIRERNFRHCVLDAPGGPVLVPRAEALR